MVHWLILLPVVIPLLSRPSQATRSVQYTLKEDRQPANLSPGKYKSHCEHIWTYVYNLLGFGLGSHDFES
jgi:hypothetical protein